MWRIVLLLVLLPVAAASTSGSEPVASFRFDSEDEAASGAYEAEGISLEASHPGQLASPIEAVNRGSFRFDGQTSIIRCNLPSDACGLDEGFTWEGFFLTPSTNKYETDGGIADRFISQFMPNGPSWTRLTVGLAVVKAGSSPQLCIGLSGTGTQHVGNIAVAPDVWHHFAVVHEGSPTEGQIRWYLDYQKCGEVELTGKSERDTLPPAGSAPFMIGARLKSEGSLNRGFEGGLDEIRLVGSPLQPDQFLHVRPIERRFAVDYYETLPEGFAWDFEDLAPTETLRAESLSLTGFPERYSIAGFPSHRWGRQGIRVSHHLQLPAGKYHFLLHTESDAQLTLDGHTFIDGRLPVKDHPLGELTDGRHDYYAVTELDGKPHEFCLSAVYQAGPREELGDVLVCYARDLSGPWWLLGAEDDSPPLDPVGWKAYQARERMYWNESDPQRRVAARRRGEQFWQRRHELSRRQAAGWVVSKSAGGGSIDGFLQQRFDELGVEPAPRVHGAAFIRRLSLDIRGRIPHLDEVDAFLRDTRPDRRVRLIDRMLISPEWADGWVGYWQDVLAENPTLVYPTLNNSGPFRQWIHDSFQQNIPFDRFATELIMMEGGHQEGGTAGFATATKNDAPMAMKSYVVLKAFLAADLRCARCHDSPIDAFEQSDLFSTAAMLNDGPFSMPETSVATATTAGQNSAITSSLAPGETILPDWTLFGVAPASFPEEINPSPQRPRARLASIVTSPDNPRFGDVIVNRIWKRYMGLGLVEPVDSWNDVGEASHPDLLRYLSTEFVRSGYDVKALARLIFTSDAYQRVPEVTGSDTANHSVSTFAAPHRRRLSAEQLVDSLFLAVGKQFQGESLTINAEGANLGVPERAWHFASLPNERDRPALSMPINQTIVDVMSVFGWRGARPDPVTERDEYANPLQPLLLANGLMANRIVCLSETSAMTTLCLEDLTTEQLVYRMFLAVLSRRPTEDEQTIFTEYLLPGFDDRRTNLSVPRIVKQDGTGVDWKKHLFAEATVERLAAERRVRQGEEPTLRLTDDFRKRAEDVLWSLVNSPEFVFIP